MKSFKLAVIAALGFLAFSTVPSAAAVMSGYVTANVNERAGPSTSYPPIAVIPAGAPVTIYGCLSDNSWCDVSWYGNRGWVYASYLQVTYQSRRVGLPSYIAPLGIPYVTFNFGSYWDSHYRSRPFYGKRSQWRNIGHDRRPGPGKLPPKQPPKQQPPKAPHYDKNRPPFNANQHNRSPGQFQNNNRNDRGNWNKGSDRKGPNARRGNNNRNDRPDCWKNGRFVCQ